MNILIACEFSAVVRDALIARGHNAWSCDLLPTEGRQANHLIGDVRRALDGNVYGFPYTMDCRTNRQPLLIKWDALIAFPECTYVAGSGWHWNKRRPERAAKSAEAIAFAKELWSCDIPRICLENPIGVLSRAENLGKPTQIIQPWQFGHDASKATCLWLKGLPALVPTKFIAPRFVARNENGRWVPSANGHKRWANQTDSGQNRLTPSPTRSADRARTYAGIAIAMAKQWF